MKLPSGSNVLLIQRMKALPKILLVLSLLFALSMNNLVGAEIDAETGLECVDSNENCPFWFATGECETNAKFMRDNCRKSCDRCKYRRVANAAEMNKFIESRKQEVEDKKKEIEEKKKILNSLKVLAGEDEL